MAVSVLAPAGVATRALRKVPEVALIFWVVKLLTTAMGEATTDFFVYQINPYVAVALGCLGLAVALAFQLAMRRYVAGIYWFTVAMVAVFGTMAADVLHVVLHIPYYVSSAFFALGLAVVFVAWYRSERTLSFHHIYPGRRELFYWATVMATFALGTATGDMTAATLGLGYFPSILVFAVLFAVPAFAFWRLGLNAVAAFWWAYVVTRPLGASTADWLGKSYLGGLGYGDGKVAIVLTILIVCFVAYLTVSGRDTPSDQRRSNSTPPARTLGR